MKYRNWEISWFRYFIQHRAPPSPPRTRSPTGRVQKKYISELFRNFMHGIWELQCNEQPKCIQSQFVFSGKLFCLYINELSSKMAKKRNCPVLKFHAWNMGIIPIFYDSDISYNTGPPVPHRALGPQLCRVLKNITKFDTPFLFKFVSFKSIQFCSSLKRNVFVLLNAAMQ